MAKVELKQPIVEEISELLNGAATAVVVDYRGLTVAEDTELRKQLREAGVVYKVYKNTLVKRVVAGTEFEPITDALEGTNAIAFCKTDATAPARILANFAKTANALELKCGVVEGTFYDAAGIATIATIPSREELMFGYRERPTSTTNFVGDFDINYLLTPSGNISLKAYSETNDRYFSKSSMTTQGVGILLKRDFKNFKSLFQRKKKAGISRKKKQ